MIDPREPRAQTTRVRHLGPKLAKTDMLLAGTPVRPAAAAPLGMVGKVENRISQGPIGLRQRAGWARRNRRRVPDA